MASLKQRGNCYLIQYYIGTKQKRISLGSITLQLAKEKLRQFQSAQARGADNPLPTRSTIADVLTAYIAHIRAVKTPKSAQSDIYYLREMFGPICDALRITSRRPSLKTKKRPVEADRLGKVIIPPIEANHFEAITTADVARFIETKIRRQGIAPKTCNHYRSILRRLFNWATKQHGLKIPDRINPAAELEAYREKDRRIRYLTLAQVDEQLHALRFKPQMQTMVAALIYAGLRRAELLWLTVADVDLRAGRFGIIRVQPKTSTDEQWTPKTGKARVVPISSDLRRFLDAYTPRPSNGPEGGWMFPSPAGTRWEEDNFATDLRIANREAGLVWSCLDYRHTFGSQLAQRGVSLFKIATLMGNSPEICRRHYAALCPEAMTSEVEFHGSTLAGSTRAGG